MCAFCIHLILFYEQKHALLKKFPSKADGFTFVHFYLEVITLNMKDLYHFASIFLIPVTVFPTRFPHRNSEKCHYETNIIPYFATFENSWEKLIIRANFEVIRGLTASHDPKICTHCECFPHSFSRGHAVGK